MDELKKDAAEWFAKRGLDKSDIGMVIAYIQVAYQQGQIDQLSERMNKTDEQIKTKIT